LEIYGILGAGDKMPRKNTVSKVEQAYQYIRNAILNNEFVPGEKIYEQNLCEKIGMSRTPIRGAIEKLVMEGFIENSEGRGLLIPHIRFSDILEIAETRIALDCLAFELAAVRMSQYEIEQAGQIILKEHAALENGKLNELVHLDEEYQMAIIKGAKNNVLIQLNENLIAKSTRGIAIFMNDMERAKKELKVHEDAQAALLARDGKQAAKMHREYLEDWILFVKHMALENFYAFK